MSFQFKSCAQEFQIHKVNSHKIPEILPIKEITKRLDLDFFSNHFDVPRISIIKKPGNWFELYMI